MLRLANNRPLDNREDMAGQGVPQTLHKVCYNAQPTTLKVNTGPRLFGQRPVDCKLL